MSRFGRPQPARFSSFSIARVGRPLQEIRSGGQDASVTLPSGALGTLVR
jgi:hypothetical protein